MIGDILGKALVVVKGDTSHARAEIEKLSATEQKAAKERIKAQEETNAAYERGQQKFALAAAGVAAGWAIASAGTKKYEEHLKSLGSAGAAEMKKLTDAQAQLNQAQDTLLIAVGKLAVAAAPAATELAKMADALVGIVNGIGAVVSRAADLPGGSLISAGAKWAWRLNPATASTRALGAVINYFGGPDQYGTSGTMDLTGYESGGPAQQEGRERIHPSVAKARGWVHITGPGYDFWRPPTDAEKRTREQKKKEASRLSTKYDAAWRTISDSIAATSGRTAGMDTSDEDLWRAMQDALTADEWSVSEGTRRDQAALGAERERSALAGANFDRRSALDYAQRQIERFKDFESELAEGQRESMLTRIFGPVGEFDAYASGFDLLAASATAAFQAWISGSEGAVKSARMAAAQTLAAKATELLGIGMSSIGRGIVDVATGNPKGIGEIAAGGKALAQAAAIGLLARGLNGSSGSGGGASAGGSYATSGGIGGGARGDEDRGGRHVTVVMGDGFADNSPAYTERRVRRAIERATQNNGVTYG